MAAICTIRAQCNVQSVLVGAYEFIAARSYLRECRSSRSGLFCLLSMDLVIATVYISSSGDVEQCILRVKIPVHVCYVKPK